MNPEKFAEYLQCDRRIHCAGCRANPAKFKAPKECPFGVTLETLPTRMGLGDLVAMAATPIARALHLPCIDPKTNDLRPESGCAKRKAKLNALT